MWCGHERRSWFSWGVALHLGIDECILGSWRQLRVPSRVLISHRCKGAVMSKGRLHSIVWTALAGALFALPAVADSQARIVRLSDVQGRVQIDKNSGLGFENAFLNLPVTQGTQLRTRDNGRAEIEFEDGSTLRLTPNTTVEFSTLGLNDGGKRLSAVHLVDGLAYVNWLGKSGDTFTLNFSREKIELTQPSHFRVAISSRNAEVANFRNEIDVMN